MTNQQNQILDYLKDGDFHCMASKDFFMKDDRSRISELRRMGYTFEDKPCDGRCGVKHNARLLMRRLTGTPDGPVSSQNLNNYVRPVNMPLEEPVDTKVSPDAKGWTYHPPKGNPYFTPEERWCCDIARVSKGKVHSMKCSE